MNKPLIAFILTAAMPMAFLGNETVKKILNYDFKKIEDRDSYIKNLVDIPLKGGALMNKKIGVYGSVINFIAVICFAISMLFGFDYGSYFSSMFVSFSFVLMMCGYAYFAEMKAKLAGYVSVTFAAVYTVIILLVYFTQLTTVRLNDLTQQAAILLDFKQCGLLFNYDLLGYALMALSTFFAGFTIGTYTKTDRCLKLLLMIHGVFFISCLIFPMLGLFKPDSPTWIGVVVLEFWCLYFCPISILSYWHFSNCKE